MLKKVGCSQPRLKFCLGHDYLERTLGTAPKLAIMRPAPICEDSIMRRLIFSLLLLAAAGSLAAQTASDQLSDLPKPHNYVLKRSSSYDRTGGNADAVLCRQEAQ